MYQTRENEYNEYMKVNLFKVSRLLFSFILSIYRSFILSLMNNFTPTLVHSLLYFYHHHRRHHHYRCCCGTITSSIISKVLKYHEHEGAYRTVDYVPSP